MKISFNKKPARIFFLKQKDDWRNNLAVRLFKTYYGVHYTITGDVYAFHFEKRHKKVEITKKKIKTVTGQKSFHRNVVSEAVWEFKAYVFSKEFLNEANLKVVQHARHFELVTKGK